MCCGDVTPGAGSSNTSPQYTTSAYHTWLGQETKLIRVEMSISQPCQATIISKSMSVLRPEQCPIIPPKIRRMVLCGQSYYCIPLRCITYSSTAEVKVVSLVMCAGYTRPIPLCVKSRHVHRSHTKWRTCDVDFLFVFGTPGLQALNIVKVTTSRGTTQGFVRDPVPK